MIVRGRVQGIGFRWFVREHAQRLGVAGWVRNLPDGSVELEVAGADAAILELMRYGGQGPEGAAVEAVEEHDPRNPSAVLPRPFSIER
jgi:acylphosphatase